MNFVLHFHLAARALGTADAGAGAMLPDVWRMADRRVRAREGVSRERAREDEHGSALAEVLAGIEHHLSVDRVFHTSPHFTRGEPLAFAALKRVGAPKVAMFAHVAWEIALDGALVRVLGAPETIAAIRAGLDRALAGSPSAVDRAAERHHFDRTPRSPEERSAFDLRVRKLAAAIAEGPWIAGYADAEGLAVRLAGVRARLGLTPLDGTRHRALVDAMATLAAPADRTIHDVLADAVFTAAAAPPLTSGA